MELNNVELAWAAGLFEGEGCFSMSSRGLGNAKRPSVYIGSTDKDVIDRFHAIVGRGKRSFEFRKGQGSKKSFYIWRSGAFETFQFIICLFWNWLGIRRRNRAKEILSLVRLVKTNRIKTHCPKGHTYSKEYGKGTKESYRYCEECRRSRVKLYMRARRAKLKQARNGSSVERDLGQK